MADKEQSWVDKFRTSLDEEPKSNQPDKRPLDKNKTADFMKGFSGESDNKEAGDSPMKRRMDQLKPRGY